jgi:hypothetical protein
MNYYTYAYLREDGTPYYIGKGKRDRIYSKNRRVKPPKDKSRIIFLKQNLTEEEAFKHEIYMIAVFGRKDLGTGILRNLTDGGDGISNPSEETRKKISTNVKKAHAKLTPEQRREIARKGHFSMTPEQRSERAKKGRMSLTPEKRSELARIANASLTPEQRRENAKKANAKLTPEQRRERGIKAQASRTPEQRRESVRRGHATLTPEQRKERTRKANATLTSEQRSERSRKGYLSTSIEKRIERAKKGSNQKWQCTVTGFISNAGGLSTYQRARGIDTTKRIRLS